MPALGFLDGRELRKAIQSYQAGRGSPPNTCASFPHCKRPPADERAFCDEHQTILDGVAGKKKTTAEVFHSDVPKPVKVRKSVLLEPKILEQLAAGAMSVPALAEACGVNKAGAFDEARKSLLEAGKIVALGAVKERTYALNTRPESDIS
jgi:hypothetical protein